MATANQAGDKSAPQARRRRWPWLLLALVAGAIAWFWGPLNGYAIAGTSYGARVACSCKFLGGRVLDDCRKDFEPGMELIMLSEDPDAKSVTATFPLLASQTATFREGEGCRLEPWDR
jgi:hypothetical protein